MAGTQLVFTGVPAFVSVVTGPTTVRFSIDENDFDPAHLIAVDLANNPQAVAVSSWAQGVDCDYQTTGGLTTIGPKFHAGPHVGGVYLADRLVTLYAAALAAWPKAPDAIYQFQLVLRASNSQVARYHGFKAVVVSAAVGSLAHLAFVKVGETTPSAAAQWIDLADASVCDPAANGFTTIVPSSPVGTVGAVFLSAQTVSATGPTYPKYPSWFGW